MKPTTTITLTLTLTAALAAAYLPAPALPLERLDYHAVRLTPGPLKRQLDETAAQYLAIPNDDLLKGFRQRAHLPAPGADLGGWYTQGTFHAFGQYLSGLSRLYAATGNDALREKVIALIDGWAATIAPDGFFFYKKTPQAPPYVYEKTQAGLLDAYLYANYPKALEHMTRITAWAEKNLPTDRAYAQTGSEWYTLSENLYRAYEATGDKRYRDFAQYWEYTQWWTKLRTTPPDRLLAATPVYHHAYSHLNTASGAAMAYRVTHDPKYLATAKNAHDFYVNTQTYITGGFGPAEQLVTPSDRVTLTHTAHHNFEIQCGAWAAFKLCKYLLEFTGDARYGDWIEKLIINATGATIPMTPDGRVMYYADYNCKRATKHNYNHGWTCCTGTRPQAIADYVNLIYFKSKTENTLYINYYTPSTVNWNNIQLEQTTTFPETPATTIHIRAITAPPADVAHPTEPASGNPNGVPSYSPRLPESARATLGNDKKNSTTPTGLPLSAHPLTPPARTFTLALRIPSWLAGEMTLRVNNAPAPVPARAENGWLKITREWRPGDRLDVTMPMTFRTQRIDPAREYPVAMAYGPIALVVQTTTTAATTTPTTTTTYPLDYIDLKTPGANLIPDPAPDAAPLTWRVQNHPDWKVQPYYRLAESEPYNLYIDPRATRFLDYDSYRTTGPWNTRTFYRTGKKGATLTARFEGTGIKIHAYLMRDGGKAKVEVDGAPLGTLDCYGPHGRELATRTYTGLPPGPHEIKLTLLGESTPPSTGQGIYILGMETTD